MILPRHAQLEARVNSINNGQRAALEQRLDEGTAAISRVSDCLEHMGQAFAEFATKRPCLRDSDAVKLAEIASEHTPDPEALATIARHAERKAKREGTA